MLRVLDGRPFPEYRRLVGRHKIGEFDLVVDRVPPDPFSGSARIRLVIPRAKSGLPADLVSSRPRRIALEDLLSRSAVSAVAQQSGAAANAAPGSGRLSVPPCGPAMLERSTSRVTAEEIELRLSLDLPSVERRIRGLQAEAVLGEGLERLAAATLLFPARRVEEARRWAGVAEDHAALQQELVRTGLVAFVADGSRIARSGVDDGPRRDGREVPLEAPEPLARNFTLPHAGSVRGLAIPAGVTVLVGGTMHGKSTLLRAIAAGVHPHPPGDGRELVATLPEAVWVGAQPGRPVHRLDLSAFLGSAPTGEHGADFSTESAGPALSQAACAVEAIEAGARLLLVDEDASAVGFLARDGRMQRLVPREAEPLVSLLDRARSIYERLGVSTIVATGALGDFVDASHTVILADRFRICDATERGKALAHSTRSVRLREDLPPLAEPGTREPFLESPFPAEARVGVVGTHGLRMGEETIELAALGQIVEPGQLRALGRLLVEAASRMAPGTSISGLLDALDALVDESGLDALDPPAARDLARPRRFEVAAALARWRAARMRRPGR